SIPPQNFNQMTSTATEHKHVSRKGILLQLRLHHPAQAREAAAQIGQARHNPDLRVCRQRDHPSSRSNSRAKAFTSALPSTRIRVLPNLIEIEPLLPAATLCGSAIFTGNSCSVFKLTSPIRP